MSGEREKQIKMVERRNRSITDSVRPSVLYRPTLTRGKTEWFARYGGAKGCSATGATPAEAMENFDLAWCGLEEGGIQPDADKVLGGKPEVEPKAASEESDEMAAETPDAVQTPAPDDDEQVIPLA